MNKTQRVYNELLDELTQYASQQDAKHFANWLLAHYKIGEYQDVQSLNLNGDK
jgi:hypothetical protein|tara:strand:- start:342 stop:500 length:159 start_codon:yes stop_codon:yes gene_type:complete